MSIVRFFSSSNLRTFVTKFFASFLLVAISVTTLVSPQVAQAFSMRNVTEERSAPKKTYDLVAVVVDEKLFNDSNDYDGLQKKYDDLSADTLKDRVMRYSEDIQKTLPDTKTIILPIASGGDNAPVLQRILERLYFEGDPQDSDGTQLKGVVLVGDVSLPIVNKNGNRFVSLLPYTDFVDPAYVWSQTLSSFVPAKKNGEAQPEAWHGVIRAGREQIAEYFDKNHLYHIGNPAFSQFRKKILMSDLAAEEKNLNVTQEPLYENSLKNMEDLAYNRYTAKWLSQLQKEFSGNFAQELKDLKNLTSGLPESYFANSKAASSADNKNISGGKYGAQALSGQKKFVENLLAGNGNGGKESDMKDILTVPLIQKLHIPYTALFGSYLSKVNDFVASTGRWTENDVDTAASLISKKDVFAQQLLLSTNQALEPVIDEKVATLQQPFDFMKDVTVSGRVGSTVVGVPGYADGKAAMVPIAFNNQSFLKIDAYGEKQFINGISADLLTSVQQCSLVSGTTQGVLLSRVYDPGSINYSDFVIQENKKRAAKDQLDVRMIPTLGVHTRVLSSAEASEKTGGASPFGAIVEGVSEQGLPAVFPGTKGLHEGDVILNIDGQNVDSQHSVDFLIQQKHHPDLKYRVADEMIVCRNSSGSSTLVPSCDAKNFQGWQKNVQQNGAVMVSDFAKVRVWNTQKKIEEVKKIDIRDLNSYDQLKGSFSSEYSSDAWYPGCNISNNNNPDKCFRALATLPVKDPAGGQAITNSSLISEQNSTASCTSFFPALSPAYNDPDKRDREANPSYYTGSHSKSGSGDPKIRDFVDYRNSVHAYLSSKVRGKDPSDVTTLTPTTPSLAPSDVFFTDNFTLEEFFHNFPLMDGADNNGNAFDTNRNGLLEPMAWVDLNGNGKVDLLLDPSKTVITEKMRFDYKLDRTPEQMNAFSWKFPSQNGANNSGEKGVDYSLEKLREKYPQMFVGDKYVGSYTGEFIGGDYGVDEPEELSAGDAGGNNPLGGGPKDWDFFVKKFLSAKQNQFFASARHLPTQRERLMQVQAVMEKIKASSGGDLLPAQQFWLSYGENIKPECSDAKGASCEAEKVVIRQLQQDTSDLWFSFEPHVAKQISSVFTHKEPTAATLTAQFQSMTSDRLPIDKPRFTSYLATGGEVKIPYPNAFDFKNLDDFLKSLDEIATKIGVSPETLRARINQPALKSVYKWLSLDLNSKHRHVLLEYLNPDIDAYADDSPDGFEAWYFVAPGTSSDYRVSFQNKIDAEKKNSGGAGVGNAGGGSGSNGSAMDSASDAAGAAGGSNFYNEPLPIFELPGSSPWFEGIKKWLDDIKKSFKPVFVSLNEPHGANLYNEIKSGAVSKTSGSGTQGTKNSKSHNSGDVDTAGGAVTGDIDSATPDASILPPSGMTKVRSHFGSFSEVDVVSFDIQIQGPGQISGLNDSDSEKNGFQFLTVGNTLDFDVSATADSGTIHVKIAASVDDKKIEKEIKIDIRSGLSLHLDATDFSLPADGISQATLTASIVGSDGKTVTDYRGPLAISLDGGAALSGETPDSFTSGTASFALRSGKTPGQATVTIASDIETLTLPIILFTPGDDGKKPVIGSSGTGYGSMGNSGGNGNDDIHLDTANLKPKVLYASLLGSGYGDVTGKSSLGREVLFSGATQAVSSFGSSETDGKPVLFVRPDGFLEMTDGGTSLSVVSSNGSDPLQIDVFSGASSGTLREHLGRLTFAGAEFTIRPAHSAVTEKNESSSDTFLKLDGKNVVRVNRGGGLQILDANTHFTVAQESGFMTVVVSSYDQEVARIEYRVADISTVGILYPGYVRTSRGVFFEPDLPQHFAMKTLASGGSDLGPQGLSLRDLRLKLDANQQSGMTSKQYEGVGFHGRDKSMLLLAAGNTVGDSFLPYASEMSIVLGDPTVKLTGRGADSDNISSPMGFTKDLGSAVYSSHDDVSLVLPIDVHGSGQKDLLIGHQDGNVHLLERQGSSYRDRGVALFVKNGIADATVADIDNDGQSDVVLAALKGCTLTEACVDIYRNDKGFFTRINTHIEVGEQVFHVIVKDINLDDFADLVTSDSKGDVRVFYNKKGQFEKNGQLVAHFDNTDNNGAVSDVLIGVKESYPNVPGSATPIIMTSFRGSISYFYNAATGSASGISDNGHVQFQRIDKNNLPAKPLPTIPDSLIGSLTSDLPRDSTSLGDFGTLPLGVQQVLQDLKNNDEDSDGLPDAFDPVNNKAGASGGGAAGAKNGSSSQLPPDLNGLSAIAATAVQNAVKALRCSGGCAPMPVNYSFLTPGPINTGFGVPSGFDGGLPVFGWGNPCTPFTATWPPCPFQGTVGRLYVSPTLTMGLGFAVCQGPYLAAECHAFAIPTKVILGSLCDTIAGGFSSIIKTASSLASNLSPGSGYDAVAAYGGNNSASDFAPQTGAFTKTVSLGGKTTGAAAVSTNIRVPGFPGFLTEWLDRQIEEALDKLSDLPDLYLIVPSFSSLTGSVLPKIPKAKLTGYNQFLSYLNSIPLIKIEPKELEIKLPAITPVQILRMKNHYEQMIAHIKNELERIKNQWTCFKNAKDSTIKDIQLCEKIRVGAEAALNNLEKNIQALEAYQQFPKKILEYRQLETKYLRQIINYLTIVTNYTGGYIKRQQVRLEHWLDAAQKVKQILTQWQGLIDVTLSYEQSCSSCKTDRGSLLQMLVSVFVQIPSPPIIQFPKWPDIVIDISKIQAGVKVYWPDLHFTPVPIALPNLPSVNFPLLQPPNLNFPEIQNFFKWAADLPVLRSPPDLPLNLPDLPPLPLFTLPDIPPAPKIPDLGVFPLLKQSLDVLKNILKVVCLIKTGMVPVPESSLKTEIETLTARPVNPPLPAVDLNVTVKPPAIQYAFTDKIKLEGRASFQLETGLVYNFFKAFADLSNSLVQGFAGAANLGTGVVNKTLQQGANVISNPVPGSTSFVDMLDRRGVPQDLRLVAQAQTVDPKTLDRDLVASTDNLSGSLPKLRATLLASLQNRSRAPSLDSWIALVNEEQTSRLLASSSASDAGKSTGMDFSMLESIDSAKTSKATQENPGNFEIPSDTSSVGDKPGNTSVSDTAAQPRGLYIFNNTTLSSDRLIAFNDEMERGSKIVFDDLDGDSDSDVLFTFGGDVYVKNSTAKKADTTFVTSDPKERTVSDLLPLLDNVKHLSVLYQDDSSTGIEWSRPAFDDGTLAGYDVLSTSSKGTKRQRLLFPDAPEGLKDDEDFTVESLSPSKNSLRMSLANGFYFLQMRPLLRDGSHGTVSSTALLAPQICGDDDEPFVNLGTTGNKRSVSILKTLTIDASVDRANAPHTTFFVDLDIHVDSNKDGDATNDRDLQNGSNPKIILGPFTETGTKYLRIWAVDQAGNRSSQDIILNIYKPDIVLTEANTVKGTVAGFLNPREPQMPFSLVRERGGVVTALGKFMTDNSGSFFIDNLETQQKMAILDAKGSSVATLDPLSGLITLQQSGATLTVESATGSTPNMIRVKSASGITVGSMFLIPKKDGSMMKDANPDDAFDIRSLASTDPVYGGGKEIVDTNKTSRVAVLDAAGRVYLLDSRLTLRVQPLRFGAAASIGKFALDVMNGPSVIATITYDFAGGDGVRITSAADVAKHFPDSSNQAVTVQLPSDAIGSGGTYSGGFTDVSKTSPYYDAVTELQKKGIIQGYLDDQGRFAYRPDQLLSRAEYAKIVLKTLCINPRVPQAYSAPGVFSDVPFPANSSGSSTSLPWFYPWVKESFLRSLITGYLGEKNPVTGQAPFKPLMTISRAEAAKILLEALRMLDVITLNVSPANPAIAPWYAPYMTIAQNLRPVLKKATVNAPFLVAPEEAVAPNKPLTRGEFAVMASRVLQAYNCFDQKSQTPPSPQKTPDQSVSPVTTSATDILHYDPGLYFFTPLCLQCPCPATLVNTADILPGDLLYAIITNDQQTVIYQKSNMLKL